MKYQLSLLIFLSILSCNEKSNSPASLSGPTSDSKDTIVVKQKNELNKSYEVGFLSKSYSYYWIADKDTLDFGLFATEYEKDSSLHLHIVHRRPMLFSIALDRINDCISLIKRDFDLLKLTSFYFKEPIYYPDLSKMLSEQYDQKFGQKGINYSKLNQFLLDSDLTLQLNTFLQPLNKTVKGYAIEKFHLLHKENYKTQLPDTDFSGYPEFTLNGMGLYIQLN